MDPDEVRCDLGLPPLGAPAKIRLSPEARLASERAKAGLPPLGGLSPERRAWVEAQWEKVGGRP